MININATELKKQNHTNLTFGGNIIGIIRLEITDLD